MVRKAIIRANDGEHKVEIQIKLDVMKGLSRDETYKSLIEIVRNCANSLESVHYTDFGIDNTKVILR